MMTDYDDYYECRPVFRGVVEEFLVCYDDGVIETNSKEWFNIEGEGAQFQTLCGQVIDLRDLKG
jgi:hypothetical protein